MEKIIRHIGDMAKLLMDVAQGGYEADEPVKCKCQNEPFGILEIEPFDVDLPPAEPKPFTIYDYDDSVKRVEVMSRLCGRWKPTGNRCEIEIERRGEHFILYNLKRNGTRTDDRYTLLWNWGDVYYCCTVNKMTSLALDIETDTLMISPGVDYTRVVEHGE